MIHPESASEAEVLLHIALSSFLAEILSPAPVKLHSCPLPSATPASHHLTRRRATNSPAQVLSSWKPPTTGFFLSWLLSSRLFQCSPTFTTGLWLTLFFWAPKSLQMVIAAMKLKDAYSLEGKL